MVLVGGRVLDGWQVVLPPSNGRHRTAPLLPAVGSRDPLRHPPLATSLCCARGHVVLVVVACLVQARCGGLVAVVLRSVVFWLALQHTTANSSNH